jgi:ADP-dependent glucokinase
VNIEKATLLLDDSFSVSLVEGSRRVPLDPASPVSCWAEGSDGWSICVAPVLVCTRAHHTAGAGDNISSAGLAMQL